MASAKTSKSLHVSRILCMFIRVYDVVFVETKFNKNRDEFLVSGLL